ncbi:MAG: hypothetical protein PUP93_16440 [Rhizonema sp. NSF051]|nr:hypothetical protein [Rhizonema sp. NSF051]
MKRKWLRAFKKCLTFCLLPSALCLSSVIKLKVTSLPKTPAHLPHPQKVDLSPITQSIEELKQSSTRLETQEIANLTKQLNALKLRLDNFPKPVDLSEILAELATLQAIDKSSINDSILQLQSQIAHICQHIQELLSPFDPSFLEKRIAELEESDRTNIALSASWGC